MDTQTNRLIAPVVALRRGIVILGLAACVSYPTPAAAQETKPPAAGTADVGAGYVSQSSFKAGEYTGLDSKGPWFPANVDIKGNTSYSGESAFRWRFKSVDLGLTTRNVIGQAGVQGKYRIRFTYDGLLRNRSDTYQTQYLGVNTPTLTLPASWLVPTVAASGGTNSASARGLVPSIGTAPYISTQASNNGALVSPTPAQIAQVNGAAAADVPLFQNVNLGTTRNRYDTAFNAILSPAWTLDVDFRPEHKDGLKPMGTVSRTTGSDVSTVIPILIDSNAYQVTAGLSFKGKRSFAQGGYYGSFYRNNVPSMSWQNWATAAGTMNTISSDPNNTFHQVDVTGGVNFSPATRVVATGSYAHNTQHDPFITNATTPVVPVNSLNGLVVSTAFTAKFTTRRTPKLHLAASYKYDNHDNQTAIHIFQYADAEETPVANASFPAGPNNPFGAVLAQNANANRPYSTLLNLASFDADYAVAKRQWVRAGYDFEAIHRSCPGGWIDCADAAKTHQQTLRAEWRLNVSEILGVRVNYAYAARRAPNYNEDAFLALVPYASVCPVTATGCVSAYDFMTQNGWTGYGPSLGYAPTTDNMNVFFPNNNVLPNTIYANNNRISELVGMRRYYVADRDRNKIRTLLSWQPSDRVSIQGRADVNHDTYPSSVYGLQSAKGWSGSLDGTFTPVEKLSVNVFYTYDRQRSVSAGNTYTNNSNASQVNNGQPGVVGLSGNTCDTYTTLQQRNNNNKLDPCLNWSADMLDRVHTLGLGLTRQADRLGLAATFILTRSHWDNNVAGGSWVNNLLDGPGAAPTTIAAYYIPATPLPTVVTDTAEVRLSGTYALAPAHSVRVAYSYLRMRSNDFAYEGTQFGSLSAQPPTSEQPFSYTQNVVSVSYVLRF